MQTLDLMIQREHLILVGILKCKVFVQLMVDFIVGVFPGLNRWQKIAYGTAFVFGRYFRDKAAGLEVINHCITDQRLARKFSDWIESGWKLAQLINFLIFLQHGRYQTLMERILRLDTVLTHKQPVRQLSFEFMNRELLWHSFAEFTFFLLPLVNWRKLRNTVHQVFDSRRSNSPPSAHTQCGICEHPPTTPYQSSCGHIFCYYCIKANCMADPGFRCTLCSTKVQSISPAHKGIYHEQ
jgi:peroxin-2